MWHVKLPGEYCITSLWYSSDMESVWFPLPSINQVYQPFFLPSFVTNKKANSSGALFICEHRIFGWNLIKYCGSNVTAAGMSIMILHCIRHGQTVKVLVMCETHVPQTVPDSISSSRFISAAPFVLFTSIWDWFCIIQICLFIYIYTHTVGLSHVCIQNEGEHREHGYLGLWSQFVLLSLSSCICLISLTTQIKDCISCDFLLL